MEKTRLLAKSQKRKNRFATEEKDPAGVLKKNPNGRVCGPNADIKELIDYEEFCGVPGHDHGDEGSAGEGLDITAPELSERLQTNHFKLLDVREPHEFQIAKIPGTTLIPLGEIAQRANELDTADDIVVYCRSGARSARAIGTLQKMGFKRLRNLQGGILAWSRDVDPSVPQY